MKLVPIVTKALYKTAICILQIWKIARHHYSQLAVASSLKLEEEDEPIMGITNEHLVPKI